jgi:hypothetical protein
MTATTILGIGVVGVMVASNRAIRAQRITSQRQAAVTLASGKLNEIKVTGAEEFLGMGRLEGSFERLAPDFDWTASIEPELFGSLYRVDVEVSWRDGTHRRSVSLTTLLNDFGDEQEQSDASNSEREG